MAAGSRPLRGNPADRLVVVSRRANREETPRGEEEGNPKVPAIQVVTVMVGVTLMGIRMDQAGETLAMTSAGDERAG